MKVSALLAKIRNAVLAFLSISMVLGAVTADYILRHEIRGKARRTLAKAGFSLNTAGIIRAIEEDNLPFLDEFDRARIPYIRTDNRGMTPLYFAILEKRENAIDALFTRPIRIKGSVNAPTEDGSTPLKVALERRDFKLADRLLSLEANLNQEKEPGLPWLVEAITKDDTPLRDFLLDKGIDVNAKGTQPNSPLALAAQNNDLPLMKRLVTQGAQLSVPGCTGKTLLLEAILANQPDEIAFLLEKGVDANERGSHPHPPLAIAAENNDLPLMKQLVSRGARVKIPGCSGKPLLVEAVLENEADEVSFLLDSGSNANEKGSHPHYPLAIAAAGNVLPVMKDLVSHGANIEIEGISGKPLFFESVLEGNHEEIAFLLEKGANPDLKVGAQDPLLIALERGDGELRDLLTSHGAKIDRAGPTGRHLAFEALDKKDLDWLKKLLDLGIPINQKSQEGDTLFIDAIKAGDYSMVDFLMSRNADINLPGAGGITPVKLAVSQGDGAALRTLIENGVQTDWESLAAIAYARRDHPTINLMLQAGMPPEVEVEGKRLFDRAIEDLSTETVRSLLKEGADIKDNFWKALTTQQDDIVILLLEAGEDPSLRGPDGKTPLEYALHEERYSLVSPLLDAGAHRSPMYSEEESWIARTIRNGETKIAMALLKANVDLGKGLAGDGHSLLAWSIANQMDEVSLALIKAGVDVNAIEPAPASKELTAKFADSSRFQYYLTVDQKIRPIMMAAVRRNHEVAKAMMDAGARNFSSKKYLYPVFIASWFADVRMMQIAYGRNPDVQPRKLVVDLSSQRVQLYENGRVTYSSICSTGKPGYSTKPGTYVITQKERHHVSNLYDADMPNFMRLSCGDFGFHTGSCPGYPASHGCIRLPDSTARKFFELCEMGDLVVIHR